MHISYRNPIYYFFNTLYTPVKQVGALFSIQQFAPVVFNQRTVVLRQEKGILSGGRHITQLKRRIMWPGRFLEPHIY